ncbi:hypothetical protein GCM10009608_11880 [Pseudonocardia alaniniphila]
MSRRTDASRGRRPDAVAELPANSAHEGITVQIYGHRSTGHYREAAELVAGLIRRKLNAGPAADAG